METTEQRHDARVAVLDDSKRPEATARNWWLAGLAFVVLMVSLMSVAWMTSARGNQPWLLAGPVVHESF